jgi:O-antigen ligase
MLRNQNQELSPRMRWAAIAALAFTIVAALISVGLEDLAKRVQADRLIVDANVRNAYTLSTLQAAQHFWPWGSGVGTFEAVFPRFQDLQTIGYVEYAHNDYPQLLMELGIFALPLMAAALYLAIHQLRHIKHSTQPRKTIRNSTLQRQLAGLGALVLMLHSTVEFNMHIPALAITASFLVGVYLRPTNNTGDED